MENDITVVEPLRQQTVFVDRLQREDLVKQSTIIIDQFDPANLTLQAALCIGREAENQLSTHLNQVLAEFNSDNSPFVFEAFKELQKGIKAANLEELESKIKSAKASSAKGFFAKVFGSGSNSVLSNKLSDFTASLSAMLQGKKESLLNLVQEMEKGAERESEALLKTMSRFDELANSYLGTVDDFALGVLYIDGVLAKTKGYVQKLKEDLGESDDIVKKFQISQYEDLVTHLHNRRLLLLNAYNNTPVQLDVITTGKQAAANTFIEVSTSLIQQLNGVKSALASWAMLITIENSQAGDILRRKIAEDLIKYGVVALDRVAVIAAETPYQRRLADAELLLAMRQGITSIQGRVLEIESVGRKSFQKAEQLLIESRNAATKPLLQLH